MADFSSTLGNTAPPYLYEINGEKVEFGLVTQATKAALEKWLFQRVLESIQEARAFMDDDKYNERFDKALKDKAAFVYSWGGKEMFAAMASLAGVAKTLSLLSKDKDGNQIEPSVFEHELQSEENAKALGTIFQAIFRDSMPQKKTKEEVTGVQRAQRKR